MTTFLQQIEADLASTIEANDKAVVDRVGRLMLDGLNSQLGRYLRILRSAPNPEGMVQYFGPNWHGPAVEDLISQSKFHRELGAVERRAAA